jgi:hypothetical protein
MCVIQASGQLRGRHEREVPHEHVELLAAHQDLAQEDPEVDRDERPGHPGHVPALDGVRDGEHDPPVILR